MLERDDGGGTFLFVDFFLTSRRIMSKLVCASNTVETYLLDELTVLGDEFTDSVNFAICMFDASSGMFITRKHEQNYYRFQ